MKPFDRQLRPLIAFCLHSTAFLLAAATVPATACFAQAPPTASETNREETAGMSPMTQTGDGELPADAKPADPTEAIESFKNAVEDEQTLAEGLKSVEVFDQTSLAFKESMVEMRRLYLEYANGNPSTRSKTEYLKVRSESRKLMNETYDAALDVLRFMPHPVAARFIVTGLLYRTQRSIYNLGTYEGAGRLLNAGVRLRYVAQSGARSGMVVGDFDFARRVYEKLEQDELEDIDRRMIGLLEQIEKQFATEKELLENQGELPQVKFVTTRGEFVADLFIDEAPSTVAHFINLVESGFYDGLDFFQVVNEMLALTGDPVGDGSSKPDQYIADEHGRETIRMPLRGSLVMAKLPIAGTADFVPNSAGTQFAILFMPLPAVTSQQTVFGRIVEGMDVLGELRRVDPNKKKEKNELVLPPDRILTAEILRRPESLPEVQYVVQPGMPTANATP
ncbi:MAG: peptidylprolyl isomerase [Planctomycetota bacterium]